MGAEMFSKDRSGKYSPDQWAREACVAYYKHGADRVVDEVNQGGDLVEKTLRGDRHRRAASWRNCRCRAAIEPASARHQRRQPISLLLAPTSEQTPGYPTA
jgi:phage terminase large subunit-like protein